MTEEDLRLKSRKLFHRIGAWGTTNAMRQNLAAGRAALMDKYDDLDDTTKHLLDEVPFGSVVNVSAPQNQSTTLSTAAKVAGAGLLAALAGLGGYMYADKTKAPPPPADAVLEWEITDGSHGDPGTSERSLDIQATRVGGSDG